MNQQAEDDALGWLARPAKRVYVGVLFLLLCGIMVAQGIAVNQIRDTNRRVRDDERASCTIQARGLPAGHELAASMAAIHMLLTFKPSAATQARDRAETPPAQLTAEFAVVRALDTHLARYQALEAEQPTTRRC